VPRPITSISVNLHMTVDTVPKLMAALSALEGRDVLVGVPAADTQRTVPLFGKVQGPQKEDGITNAALAYIHNTGSPANNIPARPFMEPGIMAAEDKITKALANTGRAVLDGDLAAMDKGLNSVGIVASSAIKNKITSGPFEPLKKSTLSARRRRGRTGTRPLVDTAQLRNSINYVVRER